MNKPVSEIFGDGPHFRPNLSPVGKPSQGKYNSRVVGLKLNASTCDVEMSPITSTKEQKESLREHKFDVLSKSETTKINQVRKDFIG
ncbi:MAG: hypothetical protein S4CHLAM7_09210 [Chlamydiae bacterium]|nr:hypothetical protein [Chlamydiota bacterium]